MMKNNSNESDMVIQSPGNFYVWLEKTSISIGITNVCLRNLEKRAKLMLDILLVQFWTDFHVFWYIENDNFQAIGCI